MEIESDLPGPLRVAAGAQPAKAAFMGILVAGEALPRRDLREEEFRFPAMGREIKHFGGGQVAFFAFHRDMFIDQFVSRLIVIELEPGGPVVDRVAIATGTIYKGGTELRNVDIFVAIDAELLLHMGELEHLLLSAAVAFFTGYLVCSHQREPGVPVMVEVELNLSLVLPAIGDMALGTSLGEQFGAEGFGVR